MSDEDDHFPWHYTELGVICACGLPMRDEVCPSLRAKDGSVPEGNHGAQRERTASSAATGQHRTTAPEAASADENARSLTGPNDVRSGDEVGLTHDIERGSEAWFARRKRLWDDDARRLLAELVKYEDEHPADAICLATVLNMARPWVRLSAPCPTCGLPGGFHDNEEPEGFHAAARARVPAELCHPPNSIDRAAQSAAKHAANQAWLAEHPKEASHA